MLRKTGKMLGRNVPRGAGGRDCPCCGEPPRQRTAIRRRRKRAERAHWRSQVRSELKQGAQRDRDRP